MKLKNVSQFFVLYSLLINITINAEGFSSNTLIQVSHGYLPIQKVKVNDLVTSLYSAEYSYYPVIDAYCCAVDKHMQIEVADIVIHTALDQKFYSVSHDRWMEAQDLQSQDLLLCANSSTIPISSITCINKRMIMHSLTVDISHTYCISPYQIIVHNCEPTTIGATAALVACVCPPAAPFVIAAEAVVGAVVASIGLYSAYKKHKKNKTFAHISEELKNNNSNTPNPKKPNDEDDDTNERSKRKINSVSKSEFFKNQSSLKN